MSERLPDYARYSDDPTVVYLRAEIERLRAAGLEIMRLAKSCEAYDEEWDRAIDALAEALK